jgi:integration host factor subunit beta
VFKSELVQHIAGRLRPHLRATDVDKGINAIFDAITAALARGDRVELRGFGAFGVRTWRPRLGRNPKTEESLHVPKTNHVAFRMAQETFARLNGAMETVSSDDVSGI